MNVAKRRFFTQCALGAALLLGNGAVAWAQPYPSKPVTIVVAYPPGGEVDVLARLIAEKLSARLHQPVIVENRNGAAGTIGSAYVAKAPPDGYTLLAAPNTLLTAPLVLKPGSGAKYDPLKDFTPIVQLCNQSLFVVVNKGVNVKRMPELIAKVKKGEVTTFASPGNGSPMHILGELLNKSAGVKLTQVPYRGTAPALADVLGGQVPMMFSTLQAVAQYMPSGSLVPLAVADTKRSPFASSVPTLAESGLKNAEMGTWQGLLGPRGMPSDLVLTINRHVNEVLRMPEVVDRMGTLAMTPVGGEPGSFAKTLASNFERYKSLVEEFAIQPD
ncbi:Bug family tripartite tricarboxylate transporter substrate binding protein [Cupriavidus oxalaticus]|uniref:ABC transporter substrate-binding protein n=1 Tax=Cupriavidus oxalaticus TaxID=96344 RepID=A0A375FN79_9BURK|nr:tripartite tricarboxylate transporter substrate binding protein [Cupriavidus oxalaticus]QRQ85842.1 tripartite tricarboxylate transporter substrate binding protein [Cupriavidus oxalaticus]QRQ95832.1 tripartite tricarboxylate transporter substrate binding protein [Cupriavidus oxalaticus]WQD84510.1 tripartite tricarboxylate transporter substrate binding protein [Cupriavidus oxalaticus]SPC06571.1 ABC transporter substrate-binding protein [Cupriavidus oxalaticus]SPC12448.1 ABC transporter substr